MILQILAAAFVVINHYPNYNSFSPAPAVSNELASCTFPASHYPAFLVCTNSTGMNLSNALIAATFTVECEPGTTFRFAGQDVWNFGPRPASARLFFSSVAGYSNLGTGSTNYWFHSGWVEIGTNTGAASLAATLNPAEWTDAGGCAACPPSTEADFWNAVANVHEVGIAFGGGDFYDVGIATTSGDAILHLNGFYTYPRFKGFRACFSEN